MYHPSDFNYHLDTNHIAQTPASPRDAAKLMVINRKTANISHHIFRNITNLLTNNDVLVLNDTKVFPARLIGTKQSGGKTEVLLIQPINADTWEAMGKNIKPGQSANFGDKISGQVLSKDEASGYITIKLTHTDLIDQIGTTPIPPYIHSPLSESTLRQEYQTVYADEKGSAAAPTAGMHFTTNLLEKIANNGVQIEKVTLHVGPGTFAKLTQENIDTRQLHHEWYHINEETVERLNQAKKAGKRIIAVGTTSCRTLESAFDPTLQRLSSTHNGYTSLFIMPPYKFKMVDALITNFHLPESSLLMLVTAFCGDLSFRESLIKKAYDMAIDNDYCFFSFGDAMLIE